MIRKSIFTLVTFTAMAGFVGCSNMGSPVSVSENEQLTTAAISDVPLQDIVSTTIGTPAKWGLHMYENINGGRNYRIYSYNLGNSTWSATGHYGTRISVSTNGRCYHINAENQIWWASSSGNGQIPNPPNQANLLDIGVGQVGSNDVIWVTSAPAAGGNLQIWKYRMDANQNRVWINMTPSGLLVAGKIAVNPSNGNNVATILDYSKKVYTAVDESRWWLNSSSPTNCYDLSMWGTKIVVCRGTADGYSNGIGYYYVYIGTNGSFVKSNLISFWPQPSVDASTYYYYNSSLRVLTRSY